MNKGISIVLEPPSILSAICGSNDGNLNAIESCLGGRITVRGNEVRVEGLDAKHETRFIDVIENLKAAALAGEMPDGDYVRAVLDCGDTGNRADGGDGVSGRGGDSYGAGVAVGEADGEKSAAKHSTVRDNIIVVPKGLTKVFPRGRNQAAYVQAMRETDITFCVGPAGTGKTFLAVAMALSLVLSKKIRKLVLTRPVVEAGESLGYLPGDLAQKINPYLRPLYDAMEAILPYDLITRMEENHTIEIAPLAYMRGRSLNDAFIILDEAQNTTKEQMKMFLTRLGQGSKAVITGDATQIDLPRRTDSGLLHAVSLLKNIDGLFFSYLNTADVVRNPLIKKIIKAYNDEAV